MPTANAAMAATSLRRSLNSTKAATIATTAATAPPRDSVATHPAISRTIPPSNKPRRAGERVSVRRAAASTVAGRMPAARTFASPAAPANRSAPWRELTKLPSNTPVATEITPPKTNAATISFSARVVVTVVMTTTNSRATTYQCQRSSRPRPGSSDHASEKVSQATVAARVMSRMR
jgi:hypothetical protein